MPGWGSFSFAFGPLVAFGALAVLVLLLRWAFGKGGSLVAKPSRAGLSDEYGLLVVAAEVPNLVEAEILRLRLVDHGIRATVAPTLEGPRLMVFPGDLKAARAVLRSSA